MNNQGSHNLFDDIYEQWIDNIISIPLVQSRRINRDIENAIQLNHNIISNLYNIRRHLEISNTFTTNFNRSLNTNQNQSVNQTTTQQTTQQSNTNYNYGIPYYYDTNNNGNLFSIVQNLFDMLIDNDFTAVHDYEDVKVTISNDIFENFNKKTNDNSNLDEYTNKNCTICISNYDKDDIIVTLPCGHFFHNECIKNWLCNEKVTCPVCRKDVRTI